MAQRIAHDQSQPLFPVSVEDDLFTSQPADARFADPPSVPDFHDARAITHALGDDVRALHTLLTMPDPHESGQTTLRVAGRRLARVAAALAALSEYVHQTGAAGLPELDAALTALNPDLDIVRLGGLDATSSAKIHIPLTPNATSRSVVVGSLADATAEVDMLADLFGAAHWRVTNLGATMPAALAVSTVAEIDPAAFVLVLTDAAPPDDTAAVIANMRAACPDIRIGLYGAGALNIAADWSADSPEALIAQIIADTPADMVFADDPPSSESPFIQDDVPTLLDVPVAETGTHP